MKKNYFVLFILLLGIFIINYSFLDNLLISAFNNYETGNVSRVIDGDTIIINNTSIRLLGINSPEKGEIGYNEAREFMKNRVLGKTVKLEFGTEKFDLYKRKLAYVFLKSANVNLESVKNGLSSPYFPKGHTKYYQEFKTAWQNCLTKNFGICKKSNDVCIKLKNWDVKNQKITLENICSYSIDLSNWSVKDEGRKKFVFHNKKIKNLEEIELTTKDFKKDYVWTKSGDSIFIRDNNNLLVYFENY